MMVDEAELGGMQLPESGERERERIDRLASASPSGSRSGSTRRAGPPSAKRKKGPIPRELSTEQLLRKLREGRGCAAAELLAPAEEEEAVLTPLIIPLNPEDQQLPALEPKLIPLEGPPVPSVSELAASNPVSGPLAGIAATTALDNSSELKVPLYII